MGAVGQTQDKRSKMIGLNNFLLITATWWRIIFRFVTLDFKWIGIKCIVLFHHLNWLSLENYLCSHEPDIVFLMCCYLNLNFWQHSVVFYGRKQGISIALKRTCFLHGGTKGYHLHWLLGICLFIPVSPVSTLVCGLLQCEETCIVWRALRMVTGVLIVFGRWQDLMKMHGDWLLFANTGLFAICMRPLPFLE